MGEIIPESSHSAKSLGRQEQSLVGTLLEYQRDQCCEAEAKSSQRQEFRTKTTLSVEIQGRSKTHLVSIGQHQEPGSEICQGLYNIQSIHRRSFGSVRRV